MASDKDYLDYILEQFDGFYGISYRKMMGEYILYLNGKIFGGIYDNRLLLKPIKPVFSVISDPVYETPYPGAKPMILVENIDDKSFVSYLLNSINDKEW